MHIGYFLFLLGFTVRRYFSILSYYGGRFIRSVFIATVDVYCECTTKYIYLRPSDIRFNSDHISKIATKTWDGSHTTIYDELREFVWKNKTARSLSRKIVVVKRKDGRGFNEYRGTAALNKLPGWWVVEGNELLWVLQTLEKFKYIEYTEFRVMSTISDEMWYALCSVTKKSKGGIEVSLNDGSAADKEELELETGKIFSEYKKHVAPNWIRMYSVPLENLRLRLSDYKIQSRPRNTASCVNVGVCHMTKREQENELRHFTTKDEMIDNHACRRPIKMGNRKETPKYKSVYDRHLDFRPYVWGFLCILFIGMFAGCCLKGCGCLMGVPIAWQNKKDVKLAES
uniref:uncharacterized protein LOC120347343 n=1 Tax=Styela clava TaxID=7725 RepID=UPI0019393A7D|nr:uncharacterized protein LOC120347343 [Styela clava]